MASSQFLVSLAIIAVVLPPIASATVFKVGDETGWTTNFDYQAWAAGKEFWVGDKLVFTYPEGVHDVVKVDGTAFNACVAPPNAETLKTGNDTITLAAPGKKWYICGVSNHCTLKQRLTIVVSGSTAPAPSPDKGSANGIVISGYWTRVAAFVVGLAMILI